MIWARTRLGSDLGRSAQWRCMLCCNAQWAMQIALRVTVSPREWLLKSSWCGSSNSPCKVLTRRRSSPSPDCLNSTRRAGQGHSATMRVPSPLRQMPPAAQPPAWTWNHQTDVERCGPVFGGVTILYVITFRPLFFNPPPPFVIVIKLDPTRSPADDVLYWDVSFSAGRSK